MARLGIALLEKDLDQQSHTKIKIFSIFMFQTKQL
jgi:hypothetical protein